MTAFSKEKGQQQPKLQYRPQQQQQSTMFWLRFYWICHFAVSIMVIVWGGMRHNHSIKYIPVDIVTLNNLEGNHAVRNCSKAFVNVFATSTEEAGALVCCSHARDASIYSPIEDGICNPPHWLFVVSRRLARFPEAWVLPLFPLFLRLVVQMIQKSASSTAVAAKFTAQQQRLTRRRFYLYVFLIQFRGWILYLLFDQIEEYFAASAGNDCWYESLLHENYQSCQGQVSDFSDHIVLYFAQILPIAFVEVLHSFVVEPFWQATRASRGMYSILVPALMLSGMLYLYIVSFMGAYKTSVYFHTWPEIRNGYLISLLVQVPLCLMQCSTTLLEDARDYFFG